MSLETEILDILKADSTVQGYVGSRLRHEWLDQNTKFPALVITRISSSPETSLDVTDVLKRVRLQLDSFADTFAEARSLADAVYTVLQGYSGTAGTFEIDSIILQNERSLGEKDGDDEVRRITQDYFVVYN